jgi:hypothetical protein
VLFLDSIEKNPLGQPSTSNEFPTGNYISQYIEQIDRTEDSVGVRDQAQAQA